MRAFPRMVRAELRDVLRSRWLPGYALLFLLLTDLLFRFGGSGERVLLEPAERGLAAGAAGECGGGDDAFLSITEFIELLLAQPVGRRSLFGALWVGLTVPLALAFVAGVGLPFLWHGWGTPPARW